jgi:hypothetical protein
MLPLVITVVGRESTRRIAFADSPVRIGRSPFAELQLSAPSVSRWEGTLRFSDSEITYFPTGTTNPAYADGRLAPAHEEITLAWNSVLTVGGFELRFSREQVPESDLRRKGKRQPVDAGEQVSAATEWLDPRKANAMSGNHAADSTSNASPRQQPTPRDSDPTGKNDSRNELANVYKSEPPPRPGTNDVIRTMGTVRVSDVGQARVSSSSRPAALTPSRSAESPTRILTSMPLHPSAPSPTSGAWQTGERPPSEPSVMRTPPRSYPSPRSEPPSGGDGSNAMPGTPSALYQQYRDTFRALFGMVSRQLEEAAEAQRPALAADLAQRYPQLVHESDFRALLRRLNLPYPRSEAPAVGDWLRDMLAGVVSPQIRLDTGLTLERVLLLLETLAQSFAEMNTAQDKVRRRWLGRAPRASVLSSDEGREILAYLLNPMADWNSRVAELEDTIRELIGHELALLRATMEGARGLLQTLSPDKLAEAEGVQLPQEDESREEAGGLWNRFRTKASAEERLWRRFANTYAELIESDRYQRVFLGRDFARAYLKAMGEAPPTKNE